MSRVEGPVAKAKQRTRFPSPLVGEGAERTKSARRARGFGIE
jgi:hypothetical protein